MSKNALKPVEQKDVLFYDDEITAVRLDAGAIYVPIRPICDYLGVDWSAQRKRIVGDVFMNEAVRSVAVTATEAGGLRLYAVSPSEICPRSHCVNIG